MTDLTVDDHGSVFILTPVSDEGFTWVSEHLPTGGLGWGMHGIAVEHRFISEIVLGAVEDGLAIQML